jgi:hypothetical protein
MCVRLASNFAGHTPEGLLRVDVISHSNDHLLSQIMAKALWVTRFFYSTQTRSNVLGHGSAQAARRSSVRLSRAGNRK